MTDRAPIRLAVVLAAFFVVSALLAAACAANVTAPGMDAAAGGRAGTSGGAGTSGSAGIDGMGGAGGMSGTGGGLAGAGGGRTLTPPVGSYRQACDGSLGVMIDGTHFLNGDDDDQKLRLYLRGPDASPLKTIDVSDAIDLENGDEADLEDAARVGDRIYFITSHGRNKDGKLERERFRFFAMDVGGTAPGITLAGVGFTSQLIDQLLVAANWQTPSTAVIATVRAASSLDVETDEELAPKNGGTSIEGLAWAPTTARPKQLLIGFRTPAQGSDSIVVSLLNPDEVVTGATARFGEAALLHLGGLGIRAMTWSAVHGAVLIVAGARGDSAGTFRVFRWSGVATEQPAAVQDITGVPSESAPEAIVAYPDSRDVQIVFDQGDHVIGDGTCKDADSSDRRFTDVVVRVP